MSESIHFSAWQENDPVPENCPLCQEASPIFKYQVAPGPTDHPSQDLRGYCCLRCGQQLLAVLEEMTLTRWAAESPQLSPKEIPE